MKNKFVLNLALFSQFLPEIFVYSNDFFLLLYFIYLFFLNKRFKKSIVQPLFFILFLVIIKIIFSNNFPLIKQFFSDYRPFLVFGILYYISDELDLFTINEKICYFLIIVLFLSIPNILGMINQTYYSVILKYYYRYVIGGFENSDNTNIAQISSLNGRFSSIFGQPATSGFFFFITTILSTRLLYYKIYKNNYYFFLLIIILLLSIFNGLVTKSSFFQLGFFLLILLYFYFKYKFLRYSFNSLFIILLVFIYFILTSNYYEDIILFFEYATSGRYAEEGNIVPVMKTIQAQNFILGLFYIDPTTKSAGDSSIWVKFVQGGLFYILLYYLYLKKHLKNLFIDTTQYKLFYLSILITMFFGEIGFTVFSQPKATFLSFVLIKMFNRY